MNTLILASSAALLIVAGAAQADEAPYWKTVGNWTVRVDRSLGYGCFIIAPYEGGAYLRIGFDVTGKQAYLMIDDVAWESIEAGKLYPVEIQFDHQPPWTAEALGYRFPSGGVSLLVTFTDTDFFRDAMRRHELTLRYRGRFVVKLRLDGSYAAIREMFECQKVIMNAGDRNSDPFAVTPAQSDPFAY